METAQDTSAAPAGGGAALRIEDPALLLRLWLLLQGALAVAQRSRQTSPDH